jgi:hypothetical protein
MHTVHTATETLLGMKREKVEDKKWQGGEECGLQGRERRFGLV